MRKSTQLGEIEHHIWKALYVRYLSLVLTSVSGEHTHCHAAIHWPSLWGVDKEEYQGRDKHKGSDDNNVHLFKPAQRFSVVLVENHKEDIDGCGKRPEYICQWKPAILVKSRYIYIYIL